jgi:hypothetical protein
MATIEIPEDEVIDYLLFLRKVNQRHRYLERFLGKRIPVEHNRRIMYLIEKLGEIIMQSETIPLEARISLNIELEDEKEVM